MKLTVTVNLNVRVGKASLNAPCYQYLAPGSILEVDGNLYPGDKYDGISTWYKDLAGNYYWSGGVGVIEKRYTSENENLNVILKPSWMSGNFDVSSFWPETTGKGITVAVIDSGIFPHEDLKDCIDYEHAKSFVGDTIEDTDGHGTHIAGIIAARGKSDLIGVAPDVKIVPIRVIKSSDSELDCFLLTDAINYASSLDHIQIINISLATKNTSALKSSIDNAINKGKIVVAASGNTSTDEMDFPAYYDNVISVSSLERIAGIIERYVLLADSSFGSRVKTCCIGKKITSCNNSPNGTKSMSGTSMATAFMSGLIALKIQNMILNNAIINQSLILNKIISSVFDMVKCGEFNDRKLSIISILKFLS